jgi:hypothetical protein
MLLPKMVSIGDTFQPIGFQVLRIVGSKATHRKFPKEVPRGEIRKIMAKPYFVIIRESFLILSIHFNYLLEQTSPNKFQLHRQNAQE